MSHGPGGATIPPLKLLREHGVEVFGGSDNIRDAWSPFGNGDMLDRAMQIGYRANFRHDEELAFAFDMVTAAGARVLGLADYGLRVGGRADFVAVEATTLAEAVATRRSVRAFTNQPVSLETVRRVLDQARMANQAVEGRQEPRSVGTQHGQALAVVGHFSFG